MNRAVFVIALISFALAFGASSASAGNAPFYGFDYKWLRDDDGDGIPNHLDDDWVPPEDGTGYKMMHGRLIGIPNFFSGFSTAAGDQLRDQDRDRDQDQLREQDRDLIRLRLRDESCK